MKYDKPEIAELGSAIDSIQSVNAQKGGSINDGLTVRATSTAYEADE